MWTMKDTRQARLATCALIDQAEQGLVGWEQLARDMLAWMSEAEVREFAGTYGLINDGSDDDDEDSE
jgi:hypothetical protein